VESSVGGRHLWPWDDGTSAAWVARALGTIERIRGAYAPVGVIADHLRAAAAVDVRWVGRAEV
jgi:hypothetical protein